MKNFKKKAIFAALMGVLSPVSSFASKARTIDNGQLFSDGRIRILDRNDFDLNNQQEEATLKKIFKQITEIELQNFDEDSLNPGLITNRLRNKIKLENFNGVPTRLKNKIGDANTINPDLNLTDNTKRRFLVEEGTDKKINSFLKNKYQYLVQTDRLGNVIGFIEYAIEGPKKIEIKTLANEVSKNGLGLGGKMIDILKHKFSSIEVIPEGENARKFYAHCGFKEQGTMIWRKISIK